MIKGLSALADKTGIVSTKSKDKFCCDKFLSCLRCPHSNFQSGQILFSIALIIFHFIIYSVLYNSPGYSRILIVLSYDLLEDRYMIDVITTKFFFLHFKMVESFEK